MGLQPEVYMETTQEKVVQQTAVETDLNRIRELEYQNKKLEETIQELKLENQELRLAVRLEERKNFEFKHLYTVYFNKYIKLYATMNSKESPC